MYTDTQMNTQNATFVLYIIIIIIIKWNLINVQTND